MFDVALTNGGAQVALSTSSDDSHPPEHMLDGIPYLTFTSRNQEWNELPEAAISIISRSDQTFWATTGLFPQEVIVRFQALMSINKIEISGYDLKHVVLERTESDSVDSFEALSEKEFERTDHQLQQETIDVGEKNAHSLRVIINSGYDHFVAIHKLSVNGKALHG